MRKKHILVVHDSPAPSTHLRSHLFARGYEVSCAGPDVSVPELLAAPAKPSVVLLDLVSPPDKHGLDLLSAIRDSEHRVPVIVLSSVGHARAVVRAIQIGAADYLVKPYDPGDLDRAISEATDATAAAPAMAALPHDEVPSFGVHSSNPRISRITELASKVADTDVPLMILGETGVGKEVLARYVHMISDRKLQPFVKVNCAALPAELLESELFGYERGAFTGAMRDKPGKFELAGNGTLLLDEIGEMSPLLQAKLLHVLQDGECYRLGATRPTRVEARVLASTNRNLEEAVAKGDFRQDLFFRLNVIRLELPPLRARVTDIPNLCHHFLEKYSARYRRTPPRIPDELMEALERYPWPGNVRQLENVIRRYVILPEVELALSDLVRMPSAAHVSQEPASPSLHELSASAADQAEREIVLRTLDEVMWNRKEAAKRLHICYKSLLNKLRRWQIPGRAGNPMPVSGRIAGKRIEAAAKSDDHSVFRQSA